ncbi:uncharacterized protein [Branchiostoma lanceolatum]|uniref:uncharacterized protein n=1 Tax=Branchiostoma lanceolatum TaxID=7740 RepID=UPI0034539357
MGKENRTPPTSPPPHPTRYRERSLSPRVSSHNPHKSPRLGSGARRSLEYRDTYRNQEALGRRREEIPNPFRHPRASQDAIRNLDFKEAYTNLEGGETRRDDDLPYSPSRSSPDSRRNVDLRNMYENQDMEKKAPEGSSGHLRTSLGDRKSLDTKDVYGGYQAAGERRRDAYGGFQEAGGREPRDVYGGYQEAGGREPRDVYGDYQGAVGREPGDVYGGYREAGGRRGEPKDVYGGFQDAGLRREAERDEERYLDRRQQLGDNLPILRNTILEDVFENTTAELQRLEGQRSARQEAIALQDMSTLNNILQKLQLVEEEEELIRRRWIRAEYANEMDHIWTRCRTAQEAWSPRASSQPARWSEGHPEGRFHDNMPDSLSFRQESIPHSTAAETGVRHSTSTLAGARHPAAVGTGVGKPTGAPTGVSPATGAPGAPPVLLFTPAGQMQDLRAYRRSFDQHRRRTSHETAGAFDPWKLVDQLADELMEDVLDAVVMEMTDACEECVENVYRSEFT